MIEPTLNPDILRERLRDLCERYHGIVRRACRRYVQNPDDADDLAQEVLIKAARAWEGFAGACAPSTWLHRVAANHCADHHRRNRRRRDLLRLYAAGLPDGGSGGTEDFPSGAARMLEEWRAGLGCFDRHIVHLRFDVGMKQEGIARITGMTRAGVAWRLRKIRERAARLREEMRTAERAVLQNENRMRSHAAVRSRFGSPSRREPCTRANNCTSTACAAA